MISFWKSPEKLTSESLKVQWLGIGLTFVGLLLSGTPWLPWLGLFTAAGGTLLRHRADALKRIEAAPRILAHEQAEVIRDKLKDVPKCPMTVGFLGTDMEARQYAVQIDTLLKSVGFHVVRLEGFMVFELQRGLTVTAYNSDLNNSSALGIRDAFLAAGIETKLVSNPNRSEPTIELAVHAKPGRKE